MIEVYSSIYVGNEHDYEINVKNQQNWKIIQACKEPYHRKALGYSGRGAPKEHPEYLFAYRDNRLILNMIDVTDYNYIPKEIIDEAVNFFSFAFKDNNKILIHCNQGFSRSPSIAMLCLRLFAPELHGMDFKSTENKMRELYPTYNPAKGIRDFMVLNWEHYINKNH